MVIRPTKRRRLSDDLDVVENLPKSERRARKGKIYKEESDEESRQKDKKGSEGWTPA